MTMWFHMGTNFPSDFPQSRISWQGIDSKIPFFQKWSLGIQQQLRSCKIFNRQTWLFVFLCTTNKILLVPPLPLSRLCRIFKVLFEKAFSTSPYCANALILLLPFLGQVLVRSVFQHIQLAVCCNQEHNLFVNFFASFFHCFLTIFSSLDFSGPVMD